MPFSVADADAAVAKIAACPVENPDDAVCSLEMERRLYRRVLLEVAAGHEQSRALARAALKITAP